MAHKFHNHLSQPYNNKKHLSLIVAVDQQIILQKYIDIHIYMYVCVYVCLMYL